MSILLIDSYDSFSSSFRRLLEKATECSVITIKNDTYQIPEDSKALDQLLQNVMAVAIGPGPGSPLKSEDIGVIPYVLTKKDLPILGVCLGFQCLCLENGCKMKYLDHPVHGQTAEIQITSRNEPLFDGIPSRFRAVRYHSIHIIQNSDSTPSTQSPEIIPLAYCYDEDKEVLMAARHICYPHFGVQYHPESICSEFGLELVRNFWNIAQKFRKRDELRREDLYKLGIGSETLEKSNIHTHYDSQLTNHQLQYIYLNKSIHEPTVICEAVSPNFLLLNSCANPGEWSFIGLPEEGVSEVFTHSIYEPNVIKISKWRQTGQKSLKLETQTTVWSFMSKYMGRHKTNFDVQDEFVAGCPFKGGLIGFISYEEGLSVITDIDKKTLETNKSEPDIKLCFIERFIAINRKSGRTVIASIRPKDSRWLETNAKLIEKYIDARKDRTEKKDFKEISKGMKMRKPDKAEYIRNFASCQRFLHSGDSYELCLTTTTKLEIPAETKLWDIYLEMIQHNPSPYSVFFDFGDSQLLSTSPERFLSWNRDKCQMRPIKGTVSKRNTKSYRCACEKLLIPKEMGENLMIVDLIRHDLSSLLENVKVKQLMKVEEYQTVYQLVSVIEGKLKDSNCHGIDVLKSTLPPGSMTGAPKKRSVEILEKLELYKRRGIYSGVCGYWSVDDIADWSVVIRSLFGYNREESGDKTLYCGAGGAITVLSNAESEWQEMNDKLDSVVRNFERGVRDELV